jgi:NAD(P)-dependent dehydrogenase (short-subunit alcohol dehydrogenase family)
MDIKGRVALVTGGAIGTGRAIALALAGAGAEVVVCDINGAGVKETASMAPAGRCRPEILDVTDPDELGRLVRDVRPQVLVNNAGGGGHIPPHFPDAPREHWQGLVTVNLLAPMWATQEALGPMRAAGQGAVVNVASTAGLGLAPYQSPAYGAAKAGLIRFTSTLTGLHGVRVNCLVPDWVATERVSEAERATVPPPVPLEVVTTATLRLVTDDSLSGRILVLDRGQAPRLLEVGLRSA